MIILWNLKNETSQVILDAEEERSDDSAWWSRQSITIKIEIDLV